MVLSIGHCWSSLSRRTLRFVCVLGLIVHMWPVSAFARQAQVVILHTTDLHGHVWPARDYDGTEGLGGLLRCATLIEELRDQYPNALLVDAGDLYQGGIESYLSRGQIMNEALAWLKYDAWVLGNHEFDWGIDVLANAVRRSAVPVLAANVGTRPGAMNPLPDVRPYLIRQVDGVRVALVGLTTDYIPHWIRPDLLGDVVFEDSVDSLRRVLPMVRAERPDIMVLVVHQGYRPFGDSPANQINRIARYFPEFDLIIGGHSHQPVDQVRVNGVLYTQAGYYGIWLGKATLVYDTVARRVIDRSARVIRVGDAYPQHAGLQAALQPQLDEARVRSRQAVGRLGADLTARTRTPGQSGVQQLIARSMAAAVGADIVLHGRLADESLAAGTVYERDIWRIVPYENTIGVLLLTVREIREILEQNVEHIRSGQFLGVYGIHYELHDQAAPGSRVRNMRWADGRPIHARQRVPVALNSYVLASGGGRFMAARRLADDPINRLRMTDIQTRTAVRDFLRANPDIVIEDGQAAVERVRGAGR